MLYDGVRTDKIPGIFILILEFVKNTETVDKNLAYTAGLSFGSLSKKSSVFNFYPVLTLSINSDAKTESKSFSLIDCLANALTTVLTVASTIAF